jgi:hypothetical protein
VVAGPALGSSLADKIRAGLRSITDQRILADLGNNTTAIVEAQDENYNSLRDAMKEALRFDSANVLQPLPPKP